MTKTLPTLLTEANIIANALADQGGEITPDIEQMLEINGAELSTKIDAYCFVVEALQMQKAYAKQRVEQWAAVADNADKSIERLMERMHFALRTLEINELTGNEYLVKRQLNPPRVVVDDEKSLPGDYFVTETVTKLDKKKLTEMLKAGIEVSGAHLERGEKIVLKVAGRKKDLT